MRTPSILALPFLVACGAPVGDPEIVSFTVTPSQVQAGGTVVLAVELENFELTHDHGDGHGHGHDEERSPNEGHVHVYLDDFDSNPIAQMVTHEVEVEIPADLEVGAHTLLARLHDAGHYIIEPEVIVEATLDVIP